MTLSVIGAGLGRTGTLSLKTALERLGFGPCYHMHEVSQHPEHVGLWEQAADGKIMNWDELLGDYRSGVDWPICAFYRELAVHCPQAKFILTVRNAERWYNSVAETIFPYVKKEVAEEREWGRMVQKVLERALGERFPDCEHAIAAYERHNEEVQRAIPPERLLVYEVAQGWKPLSRFLAVPVPDEPFPKVNSREEFWERT